MWFINNFNKKILKKRFLFFLIDNKKESVWIGANDNAQESNFVWESDNTSLTFTDWNTGDPNNADPGEDCAAMHFFLGLQME